MWPGVLAQVSSPPVYYGNPPFHHIVISSMWNFMVDQTTVIFLHGTTSLCPHDYISTFTKHIPDGALILAVHLTCQWWCLDRYLTRPRHPPLVSWVEGSWTSTSLVQWYGATNVSSKISIQCVTSNFRNYGRGLCLYHQWCAVKMHNWKSGAWQSKCWSFPFWSVEWHAAGWARLHQTQRLITLHSCYLCLHCTRLSQITYWSLAVNFLTRIDTSTLFTINKKQKSTKKTNL